MIIHSRIGSTDCSGCVFFRKGSALFAKRLPGPDQARDVKFVSLALRVAQLPTGKLAETAIERIAHAIMCAETSVSLHDLEALGSEK